MAFDTEDACATSSLFLLYHPEVNVTGREWGMARVALKPKVRLPAPLSSFRGGVRRSIACYRKLACLLRPFIYQPEVNEAWEESGVRRL
jgi:hypothetical protein